MVFEIPLDTLAQTTGDDRAAIAVDAGCVRFAFDIFTVRLMLEAAETNKLV